MVDWERYYSGLHAASARKQHEVRDTLQRLESARDLMHERFSDPLDLDAVARSACLSRFHFARAFRRQFQITPHQYLTQRRIEHAKALLQYTRLSVTEVCMAVGFSSLGSFCTMFARHAGYSPSRYRRIVVGSLGIPPVAPPIPGCFLAYFGASTATFEKSAG
ncbi:MAG: helix-turn-helix transcriptional regulator [Nannocystaceae bacterium]|nr:helix-turn-helix transcriptional regulator [Nannocystaceae bacterium]